MGSRKKGFITQGPAVLYLRFLHMQNEAHLSQIIRVMTVHNCLLFMPMQCNTHASIT